MHNADIVKVLLIQKVSKFKVDMKEFASFLTQELV